MQDDWARRNELLKTNSVVTFIRTKIAKNEQNLLLPWTDLNQSGISFGITVNHPS